MSVTRFVLHKANLSLFFFSFFLAVLGLRCCERGLLLDAVRRLLIAVASLVAERGL